MCGQGQALDPAAVLGTDAFCHECSEDDMARRRADERAIDAAALPGAVAAALPGGVTPQLAAVATAAPAGDAWLHEIKLDGYRILARLAGGRIRLFTRKGNDWTDRFPTIAEGLAEFPARSALIDGEVVHLRPDGVSSFSALQADLSENRTDHLAYFAFDLLHHEGYWLAECRLEDRKRLLERLVAAMPAWPVRYSEHVEGHGPAFFVKACEHGLEGIVSKRRDARYRGGRVASWLKVKCAGRDDFVVIGWTDPEGQRQGFGALLLGYYDAAGTLHYAGRVGTGFSDDALLDLRRRLEPLAAKGALLRKVPKDVPRRSHWVRPALVAEVRFTEWTRERRLRAPVFLGLRSDKPAEEVMLDPLTGMPPKE
jgi:bifunctional non-homologous end joining protein LigD